LKEYDATVKGYTSSLIIPAVSKMSIPADKNHHLGIVQSYVVFQIYLYANKLVNIEIVISDTNNVNYFNCNSIMHF